MSVQLILPGLTVDPKKELTRREAAVHFEFAGKMSEGFETNFESNLFWGACLTQEISGDCEAMIVEPALCAHAEDLFGIAAELSG